MDIFGALIAVFAFRVSTFVQTDCVAPRLVCVASRPAARLLSVFESATEEALARALDKSRIASSAVAGRVAGSAAFAFAFRSAAFTACAFVRRAVIRPGARFAVLLLLDAFVVDHVELARAAGAITIRVACSAASTFAFPSTALLATAVR